MYIWFLWQNDCNFLYAKFFSCTCNLQFVVVILVMTVSHTNLYSYNDDFFQESSMSLLRRNFQTHGIFTTIISLSVLSIVNCIINLRPLDIRPAIQLSIWSVNRTGNWNRLITNLYDKTDWQAINSSNMVNVLHSTS